MPLRDLHRFYFTMPEIDYLIGVASSPRDKAIFRVLSRTGVRVGELLAIEREDLDIYHGTILIHVEKGGPYKAKRRLVPADQQTLLHLRNLLYHQRTGLDRYSPAFDITRQRVDQIIKAVCRQAGLARLLDFYSGAMTWPHAHTLRHSFAMHWVHIHGEAAILELSKVLGHSDIKTTMAYLRYSGQQLHQAYDKLWQ